jgi:hypothetical protein
VLTGGESVGDDFWTDEAWRSYSQAEYALTGTTFDVQRFHEPLADDVEGPMHEMMAGLLCR